MKGVPDCVSVHPEPKLSQKADPMKTISVFLVAGSASLVGLTALATPVSMASPSAVVQRTASNDGAGFPGFPGGKGGAPGGPGGAPKASSTPGDYSSPLALYRHCLSILEEVKRQTPSYGWQAQFDSACADLREAAVAQEKAMKNDRRNGKGGDGAGFPGVPGGKGGESGESGWSRWSGEAAEDGVGQKRDGQDGASIAGGAGGQGGRAGAGPGGGSGGAGGAGIAGGIGGKGGAGGGSF